MTFTAWALSGGGARGDFQVGVVRCLSDLGIVPSIVTSTSVGSVNGLKVAEGSEGVAGLEAVWLTMMGNGDMYAREGWTTDPDIESMVLGAVQSLIGAPDFSVLAPIEAVKLLHQAIDTSQPVIGGVDIAGSTLAGLGGLVPVIGFLVAAEISKLEKLQATLGQQKAIFNFNPLRELARAHLRQDAVNAWAAQGNRLRMAMVGLASGRLRYLTETGRVVERDGVSSCYDRDTGFEIRNTFLTGMLASSSIPVLFPPVVIADDAYVDGGIREVIPIEVSVQLGATKVFAIHASGRDLDVVPAYKSAHLLDIALRAMMQIAINEIAYADTFRVGGWGPGVEVVVLMPRVDVHDSFTIYPALIRNRMAYGYLCAADEVAPTATGENARCQAIADEISIRRYAVARLEAWFEGRPIPPRLEQLAAPRGAVRDKVAAGITGLKESVKNLVAERVALGGKMPPADGSWSDPRRWWQGWERHPLHQYGAEPRAEVFAASCERDRLDLFVVASDQRILHAFWRPERREGWEGWYQVAAGEAQPGSPVFGAARRDGALDVVVAGTDGAIFTAQWARAFQEAEGWTGWHPWTRVGAGRTAPRGAVTITSRGPGLLDAFTIGTDGGVHTAGFDETNGWMGWRPLAPVRTTWGAPVHAVSRAPDNLDIFVTDNGGSIQWTHWQPSQGGAWSAWLSVQGGRARPGAPVTAVSRANGFADLFVVGTDRGIYAAALNPAQQWAGWWRIGTASAPEGSTVTAVSRAPDQLDIFITDEQGLIRWSHWDPGTPWTDWAPLQGGRADPGSTIAATCRAPGLIDVFVLAGGHVWTAAFDPTNQWRGWWRLHHILANNPMDSMQVIGG